MKFSEAWLREWVDPDIQAEALGHRLTMSGLELDGMSAAAPEFSGVVVGEVTEVVAHPQADRLRVCRVVDGGGEELQVVCGASNVYEGMRAPFARVGATLPGGMTINKAKLRGTESFGMLCSASELGLVDSSEGLWDLPADAPVGDSLRDFLSLDDTVFEIDLTPNRADCLCMAGLAREVSALTAAANRGLDVPPVAPRVDDTLPVRVENPSACPRYAGRVIRNIDASARTPIWMQEKLRRGGIRSLGPVVDVTNFVMLELGQPMHAFDLDRLSGEIVVRQAGGREKLTLLDGQTVTLDADTLVIADGEGALAMAGIMGGEGTAVHGRTRDIFLESAHFSPQAIAGQARRYGLRTESSHRFERGVDADLQVHAIERASALLLEITGGEPGPVLEVVSEDELPVRGEILLREARIERILGVNPGAGEVQRTLTALGCGCVKEAQGWRVTPPSYRFDLSIEADLIEEIGRVYGYDRIPDTTQQFRPVIQQRNESDVSMPEIRKSLVDRGYQEVITYSFVDEETERLLNPEHSPMALANPLSADLAVMRGSLCSGMLRAVRHNLNRQQGRLKLFETGLRFVNETDGLRQIPSTAGAVTGAVLREQWGVAPREADFFDVKSDVEALLALSGHDVDVVFAPLEDPALHPGQSAGITVNGTEAGKIGALHPTLQARLGLDQRVYLFELPLEMLRRGRIPSFAPLSKFPAIRRDIAVVVDQTVPAARVLDIIARRDIPQLRDVILFDVYAGDGIPDGRKSLAFGLILQDLSRTLSDGEVESIVSGIVAGLARELDASLRE